MWVANSAPKKYKHQRGCGYCKNEKECRIRQKNPDKPLDDMNCMGFSHHTNK